ncbi:MAG: hypothetical protein ACREBJ_03200 [Nitrosotalea sp.]
MVKIVVNHNKQEVTHSYTLGQTFPDVQGKLLLVEVSGKELTKFLEEKQVPICTIANSSLTWEGKQADGILKILREIMASK